MVQPGSRFGADRAESILLGVPDELGAELLTTLDPASHRSAQLASRLLCAWSRGALGLVTGAGAAQGDADDGAGERRPRPLWLEMGPPRSPEPLHWLARRCLRLLELRLDLTRVGGGVDAAWAGLARALPALRSAWLRGATDATVAELARHCPGLLALDVAGCAAVTDASIAALANGCPRLCELSVSHCPRVTDASLAMLAEAVAPGDPPASALVVFASPPSSSAPSAEAPSARSLRDVIDRSVSRSESNL